jgi:hypothetical protein
MTRRFLGSMLALAVLVAVGVGTQQIVATGRGPGVAVPASLAANIRGGACFDARVNPDCKDATKLDKKCKAQPWEEYTGDGPWEPTTKDWCGLLVGKDKVLTCKSVSIDSTETCIVTIVGITASAP